MLSRIHLLFSTKNLFERDSPSEKDYYLGTTASVIGCCCGFGLAVYKYTVGSRLDSPAIVAGERANEQSTE
jgi:hypothetical protein